MTSLALTGGIATGKSTFAQHFLALAPRTVFFDCDACVRELQAQPEVIAEIAGALGDVQAADGSLDRAKLRALVFENEARRRVLESILHPRVRAACAAAQQRAAAEQAEYFLADVPLLYESGFPVPRDLEVVVACTAAAQRARLMARSKLTADMAARIIAAQWPLAEKMRRAGVVIWNGGTPESLRRQTVCLLASLPRS
jgi:dephospho-CoA kinase